MTSVGGARGLDVASGVGVAAERPARDLEVLGQAQTAVVEALSRAVAGGTVAHAWLLVGPAGVGQREAARFLGAALNCEQRSSSDGHPCLTCATCRQVVTGVHPAVQDFEPQGAEHRVADVRETWIPMATTTMIGGATKVLRIDRADRMNEQAQNAFLKVLEEPPASTVWILDVADDAALLDTIVSRCRRLDLRPWSQADLRALLDRWVAGGGGDPGVGSGEEPSPEAGGGGAGGSGKRKSKKKPVGIEHVGEPGDAERAAIVRLAKGSPATMRQLATCDGRRLRVEVARLVADLRRASPGDAGHWVAPRVSGLLALLQQAVLRVQLANEAEHFATGVALGVHDEDGKKTRGASFPPGFETREKKRHHRLEREAMQAGLHRLLDVLAAYVRDLLAVGSGAGTEAVCHLDCLGDLGRQAAGVSPGALVDVLEAIEEGHRALERNGQPKLALERVVMRLVIAFHIA